MNHAGSLAKTNKPIGITAECRNYGGEAYRVRNVTCIDSVKRNKINVIIELYIILSNMISTAKAVLRIERRIS